MILLILCHNGFRSSSIDVEEHKLLDSLIDQKNAALQDVFITYEKERHLQNLLQSLKDVIDKTKAKSPVVSASMSSDETVSWAEGGKDGKISSDEEENNEGENSDEVCIIFTDTCSKHL